MKNLIILFAVVLLASCTTQRKAEKWMDKNQKEAAEYCAFRFPAQESIVVRDTTLFDTVLIEAEGVLYSGGDSGLTVPTWRPFDDKDLPFKVKCPPTKVITKTRYRDSIITKVDGALLASLRFQVGEQGRRADNLQHELQLAKTDGAKWKAQRNKLRWILYALAGGAIVWLFLKLRSQIPIVGRP